MPKGPEVAVVPTVVMKVHWFRDLVDFPWDMCQLPVQV